MDCQPAHAAGGFDALVHANLTILILPAGGRSDPLRRAELGCVPLIYSQYGSYLLPQAFPEGSPTHPCYPTGHGTAGGACITALKFFYDGNQPFGHFSGRRFRRGGTQRRWSLAGSLYRRRPRQHDGQRRTDQSWDGTSPLATAYMPASTSAARACTRFCWESRSDLACCKIGQWLH